MGANLKSGTADDDLRRYTPCLVLGGSYEKTSVPQAADALVEKLVGQME